MPDFAIYPSLKDKTVIVSGGAEGIGAEIVKAFAAQGARVGFLDLNEASSAALGQTADNIDYEICDLRDITAMRAALGRLTDRLGPAHVLVNNAARDDRHDWREVTPDYWDERQHTNLRHMFFAIQAIAPGMAELGGGAIINMGSNSWWEAGGGFPAYATAKAAVHGLTRTMARDLGDKRALNSIRRRCRVCHRLGIAVRLLRTFQNQLAGCLEGDGGVEVIRPSAGTAGRRRSAHRPPWPCASSVSITCSFR
jgi:NAD(P)-dependent dehydrogenase (short-subunit alcohol dehydrogenase family)